MRPYTYQLLGGAGGEDNNKFNLLGRNLRASQTLTSEGNFSIQVRVRDDENASFDKNFTIRAIHDPNKDDDSDGLTYAQEQALGTSDTKADTDGDGFGDLQEKVAGSDPTDPNDIIDLNTGLMGHWPLMEMRLIFLVMIDTVSFRERLHRWTAMVGKTMECILMDQMIESM